eukprot:3178961-Rhodomonas_salina.1
MLPIPDTCLHKQRHILNTPEIFCALCRQQLGATQLVSVGLGDDQASMGVETALEDWKRALFRSLASFSSPDIGASDSVRVDGQPTIAQPVQTRNTPYFGTHHTTALTKLFTHGLPFLPYTPQTPSFPTIPTFLSYLGFLPASQTWTDGFRSLQTEGVRGGRGGGPFSRERGRERSTPLSAYAPPMQCPVLTWRVLYCQQACVRSGLATLLWSFYADPRALALLLPL